MMVYAWYSNCRTSITHRNIKDNKALLVPSKIRCLGIPFTGKKLASVTQWVSDRKRYQKTYAPLRLFSEVLHNLSALI